MRRILLLGCFMLATILSLAGSLPISAQINTAQLGGHVLDPQGLAVAGAKVTVRSLATGATRSLTADSSGYYQFVGLPPGRYELTVEGSSGLAKLVNPEFVLTIGEAAEFDAHLQLQAAATSVTVNAAPDLIETARTQTANTINQTSINNLPINGRNYINFSLTLSDTHRDSAPTIGAAPTSGLNFNGQRARSNEVSIDGADAVDNSVNGIRATVSQEDVQEFQIIQSNYMPEFGRAIGGVINIVTKSGSNETHGDIFGYLRDKAIQARNPFSFQVDPTTNALDPVKQDYTRVQAGATLGGAIKKDKTFYFLSYEVTRRQESGFNSIGQNDFGLETASIPCLPFPITMTSDQFAFYNAALGPAAQGGACGLAAAQQAVGAALLTSASSNVALNADMNVNANGTTVPISTTLGIPSSLGSKFFPVLPVAGYPLAPLPTPSFVGLNSLRGNYPISEGTSLWSGRIDQIWSPRNSTFLRVNVSPSSVTGLTGSAQNQVAGTDAYSRTSLQNSRDLAVVAQHSTAISNTLFNELRFQYARRGLYYGYSNGPGGSDTGVDILGYASFGREPYSTVNRIERRFQWTDNLSWVKGRHTFKFGVDTNLIQLRSPSNQIFELDFGGDYRFSTIPAGEILPTELSPIQAYGLGFPSFFLQGIGSSGRTFDNKVFAGFVQDSWKITSRLTLNYGVRYDVELTPLFTPEGSYNAAAEKELNVVEGIPRDYNNAAPRLSLAWDPWGDGKTVIRTGYGIFYDHPPLASAFLAATADGAQSVQLTFGPGLASNASINPVTALSALNASSLFMGVLNAPASYNLGYQANGNQQRFDPFFPNSFFVNQNYLSPSTALPLTVLPFTFPVSANFQFAMAQQGTLSIERQLGKSYKLGVTYTYLHAAHLNRPRNINTANPATIMNNFSNAVQAGLATGTSSPLGVAVPQSGTPTACPAQAAAAFPAGTQFVSSPSGGTLALIAPIALAYAFSGPNCSGNGIGFIGTPAIFNDFRPTGPNPTFGELGLPFGTLQQLAGLAGFPTGQAGVVVPFSDVEQQESTGTSVYNGVTISFSKRFSNHVQFLSNYTYSHAIDNSTDLQSLLDPQDNSNPQLERGNSDFDQRHRWVTSGVFESGYHWRDAGFTHKLLADFTLSPIIEVSSGLPFTVLTGTDYNLDFSPYTDRPSIVTANTAGAVSSPYLPGVYFGLPTICPTPYNAAIEVPPNGCTGDLGRNTFRLPYFFSWDMRLSRKIFLSDRVSLDVIADMFNLLNKNNVASVNTVCDPGSPSTCLAGQPTASFDARQFQFALKLNF
jgi:hypothetical protein